MRLETSGATHNAATRKARQPHLFFSCLSYKLPVLFGQVLFYCPDVTSTCLVSFGPLVCTALSASTFNNIIIYYKYKEHL